MRRRAALRRSPGSRAPARRRASKPGRSTIHALINSVRMGFGNPRTTADIATAGCFISVCRISDGRRESRARNDVILRAAYETAVVLDRDRGQQESWPNFAGAPSGCASIPAWTGSGCAPDHALRAARQFLAALVDDADVERAWLCPSNPGRIGSSQLLLDHQIGIGRRTPSWRRCRRWRGNPARRAATERLNPTGACCATDAIMPDIGLPHQPKGGRRQKDVAHALWAMKANAAGDQIVAAMADDRHARYETREKHIEEAVDQAQSVGVQIRSAGLREQLLRHSTSGRWPSTTRCACRAPSDFFWWCDQVDDQAGSSSPNINVAKLSDAAGAQSRRSRVGGRAIGDDVDGLEVRQAVNLLSQLRSGCIGDDGWALDSSRISVLAEQREQRHEPAGIERRQDPRSAIRANRHRTATRSLEPAVAPARSANVEELGTSSNEVTCRGPSSST